MTAVTERLQRLVDQFAPPDLPPLSDELCQSLDLPGELPAELTISQVAAVTGLSAHTLRYYERSGLVEVGRDPAGHRVYDHDALGRVMFVTRLRLSDMPIQAIQRYVELARQGEHTAPQRLAMLREHRDRVARRLQELQAALAVVDYKITTYGGSCGP